MTAKDIPVGGKFTIAGSPDETVYTVIAQTPGRMPSGFEYHLTSARYLNPVFDSEVECTWAGHTEVTLVPDTRTTDSTIP